MEGFIRTEYDIPLYTHPANPKYDPETGEPLIDGYPLFSGLPPPKTLTDEEILKVASELKLIHYYDADGEWSGVTNEDMFEKEKHRNDERLLEILKPFANAILRKAQEK